MLQPGPRVQGLRLHRLEAAEHRHLRAGEVDRKEMFGKLLQVLAECWLHCWGPGGLAATGDLPTRWPPCRPPRGVRPVSANEAAGRRVDAAVDRAGGCRQEVVSSGAGCTVGKLVSWGAGSTLGKLTSAYPDHPCSQLLNYM